MKAFSERMHTSDLNEGEAIGNDDCYPVQDTREDNNNPTSTADNLPLERTTHPTSDNLPLERTTHHLAQLLPH